VVKSVGVVDAKVDATDAAVVKLQAQIKAQKEEAEAAAAQEVEVAASWQFVANSIHPTNRRNAIDILVVGKVS
jgi:hypothetical protein